MFRAQLRRRVALSALLALSTVSGRTQPLSLDVSPDDDLQAKVDRSPAGTTFRLKAGIYRLKTALIPKDGDSFIGEAGATVSGSQPLTVFGRSGNLWFVSNQSQHGQIHGSCRPAYVRCAYSEDLYIDNAMLRHVGSLADVAPGRWFFDHDANRIYFYDDPTGKTVETSVTPGAFGGRASHVTIQGLTIEKFANAAQSGAIAGESSDGWAVRANEIRFNHGAGIRIGPSMTVLRNVVHHNGQLGVGGIGDDVLVAENEIAYNNTAGFDPGWEAGGSKFVMTNALIVRSNFVHHNAGPGLWTDTDNRNVRYDSNRVEDNEGSGIFHEVSYDAAITNNTVRRNGFSASVWLWGAGILVAASPNVEVSANSVEGNFNGICAIQQRRDSGAFGPYEVSNLWVHDNSVSSSGLTGLAQDFGDRSYFSRHNNHFDRNTYYFARNGRYFWWMDGPRTDTEWRGYGNDVSGTVNR